MEEPPEEGGPCRRQSHQQLPQRHEWYVIPVVTKTIRKPGSDSSFPPEAMDEHLSGLKLLGTPDIIQWDNLEVDA